MASASASTARRAPRAGARVRWDRLGRIAMLCVMGALLYLYLSAGIKFLSAWGEAKHNNGQVATLERQHHQLEEQHRALGTHVTLWREARELGMAKPGEVTYIVRGLPNN